MSEDSDTTNIDSRRRAAIERLKNRRSFGEHVVCFVVVNAFLIAIWAATGSGYFWPRGCSACGESASSCTGGRRSSRSRLPRRTSSVRSNAAVPPSCDNRHD